MVQGCPFQTETDTVAIQGSWKLLGKGKGEETLLAWFSLKTMGGLGGFCKLSILQGACFQRRRWLWIVDRSVLRLVAAAKKSRSSIVELLTCRTAHAKAAHSQVTFQSVHF